MTVEAVARHNWHKLRVAAGAGTALVYVSMCLGGVALMFYYLHGADFSRVVSRVASVVEPDSRVYGSPILCLGTEKYQYGPWLYISENEPITVREAVNWALEHRFDYAVRTVWMTTSPKGIKRLPRLMPDFREGCLCDHICRMFGTKVDEFYDPYYGPIEIYRLDWDRPYPYRRQSQR